MINGKEFRIEDSTRWAIVAVATYPLSMILTPLAIPATVKKYSTGCQIMKIVITGDCEHEIKVTRIGTGWNVRCFVNDTLNQEIRVKCREDIGVAANEMLRNEVKNGNFSRMASAARRRFNTNEKYRRYHLQSRKII